MVDIEMKNLITIDNCNEVEDTFVADDECDLKEQNSYEENCWPKEDPSGFSFKGKKRAFLKTVDCLKIMMKKGI